MRIRRVLPVPQLQGPERGEGQRRARSRPVVVAQRYGVAHSLHEQGGGEFVVVGGVQVPRRWCFWRWYCFVGLTTVGLLSPPMQISLHKQRRFCWLLFNMKFRWLLLKMKQM